MSHMAEALDTIILDGKAYVLYERPIEYYFFDASTGGLHSSGVTPGLCAGIWHAGKYSGSVCF
jgi:hypothetical protein